MRVVQLPRIMESRDMLCIFFLQRVAVFSYLVSDFDAETFPISVVHTVYEHQFHSSVSPCSLKATYRTITTFSLMVDWD